MFNTSFHALPIVSSGQMAASGTADLHRAPRLKPRWTIHPGKMAALRGRVCAVLLQHALDVFGDHWIFRFVVSGRMFQKKNIPGRITVMTPGAVLFRINATSAKIYILTVLFQHVIKLYNVSGRPVIDIFAIDK
jgi:hypothetical protein